MLSPTVLQVMGQGDIPGSKACTLWPRALFLIMLLHISASRKILKLLGFQQTRETKIMPHFLASTTSSHFLSLLTPSDRPRQPEPCMSCPSKKWGKCRGRLTESATCPDSLIPCGVLHKPMATSPQLLPAPGTTGESLQELGQARGSRTSWKRWRLLCSGEMFLGLEKTGWVAVPGE